MKSIQNQALAHCPNGCEEFEASYWSFVRADQDPDLTASLLGGELNLVRCPQCGTYFYHPAEMIYLDTPQEQLVFVFSQETQAQEALLRVRIERDYAILKDTLLKELKMDYPPVCLFGLDQLQHYLQHIALDQDESEVIAAASAAAGLQVARLKPSYARQHHFPYYVPAPAHPVCANDWALAANKVLKQGLKSTLLLHFKDCMAQEGASVPKVC